MIAVAKQKDLYRKLYVSLLGGQHKAPIEDGGYIYFYAMRNVTAKVS